MTFSTVLFVPVLALAENGRSPRDASPAELRSLVEKGAMALKECRSIKWSRPAKVTIRNKTVDYVDVTALGAALREKLGLAQGSGEIAVDGELSSTKSVNNGKFSSAYTLEVKVLRKGKKACDAVETFRKEGSL